MGNWFCGNVIVDQRVENERHIVLRDGRHLIFGRTDETKYPACNCVQRAAQHHMHADAAAGSAKSGDVQPEQSPGKPAGSQAAPVM